MTKSVDSELASPSNPTQPTTSRRGFAAMDPAKQKRIASLGGKAAHENGQAHEFTSDEARVAGRKGGLAVSKDTEHMRAIGKKGGQARERRESNARRRLSQLGSRGSEHG